MKCPRCESQCLSGAEYCVRCGSHLVSGLQPGGQALSETGRLPEIERRLKETAIRLSVLERRVKLISERMDLEGMEAPPEINAAEAVSSVEPPAEIGAEVSLTGKIVSAQPAIEELKAAEPAPASHVPERAADTTWFSMPNPLQPSQPERSMWGEKQSARPPRPAKRVSTWEESLPGNWLSRIGIIILFIGLGFLAKLAYDRGWLNPVIQLLAGAGCGGVLLLAGDHWKKTYRAWAQALTGGGIAVLYLSIFGSYALNDLMPFLVTFGLMFLVTILAVGIALRRESMAVAIIGIVGAFLVPIVLRASDLNSDGEAGSSGGPGLMIAYILVLDAGIVGLSTFRNWRWFTLLGLGGSLAVYGLWYANSGHDGSVSAAQWSLTGIFLCFVAATTLFHVVWRRVPELTDLALMSTNAAIYFCVSYGLLWGDYRGWLGIFSVALSVLYAMTGYLAWRRSEDNRRLSLFAFGIAIVFLTIAIPVQLHRSYASWITAAWAVEGAALTWIAVRQNMPKWQLWGLGAFAMALVGLFAFNAAIDAEQFRPFINDTFWAFSISILAFYASAYFLRREGEALQPWFFTAMMLSASVLTVWLFSGEIVGFAESRILGAHARGAAFRELRNIESARSLGLVSLWVAYGLCLLVAGARKNWYWLRAAGYGLMAVACVVTMALLNHSHVMISRWISQPLFNYSFGGFALCSIGLYVSVYLVTRNRDKLPAFEKIICLTALVAANVLSVWALSAEVTTFLSGSANLRNVVLVILWCAYGFLLMLAGAWKRFPVARFGGYALVAAAVGVALTMLNHSQAAIQRTNSTPVINYSFGGVFACICFIYLAAYLTAKNRGSLIDAEKVVLPVLIVAANVLTLFGLSWETLTYVSGGYGKSMGLTMLWATYALVLIVVGIVGRWRWVRLGGLALVSLAIFKLLIIDTFTLESGYRVAAYLTLGVLLLAGGFVYHRYADVIKGFIIDQPTKKEL